MILFRYHEARFSERCLMLIKEEFRVIKETKCGVWIDYYGRKKFVNLYARKVFACRTEDEALKSYHARKRRQVSILRHQLAQAEAALKLNPTDCQVYWSFFE